MSQENISLVAFYGTALVASLLVFLWSAISARNSDTLADTGTQEQYRRQVTQLVFGLIVVAAVIVAANQILRAWKSYHLISEFILGAILAIVLVPWLRLAMGGGEATAGLDKDQLVLRESRFRLLTIIIGAVILGKTTLPYVDRWFGTASNVEMWGLKLTLERPSAPATTSAVFGTKSASLNNYAAALHGPANALDRIIEITGVKRPQTALQVKTRSNERPAPMFELPARYHLGSTIQRDTAIIAYLGTASPEDFYAALQVAGSSANWSSPLRSAHALFGRITDRLVCARHYANSIRDFRLLLLDMHGVIRTFLALSGTTADSALDMSRLNSVLDQVLGQMVYQARDNLERFRAGRQLTKDDNDACPEALQIPPTLASLRRSGGPVTATDANVALPEFAGNAAPVAYPVPSEEAVSLFSTPYLAIAAASLFDSIGAFESAVSVVARWLQNSTDVSRPSLSTNTRLERSFETWMRVRAAAEIDTLVGSRSEFLSNTSFQELHETMALSLQETGKNLDMKMDPDKPAVVGGCKANGNSDYYQETSEHLRFFYAAFRQKYFQTLQRATAVNDEAVAEAGRYSSLTADCFQMVPVFTDNPNGWIGYFSLMHAELLARRGTTAETRYGKSSGRRDLDEARSQYRRAREMLEFAEEKDTKARTRLEEKKRHAARAIRPDSADDGYGRASTLTLLESGLLGSTQVWSQRLDQARRGEEALESVLKR